MADYPASYPVFTDLNGQTTLAANNHAARHNKVHAEVLALSQRVGINGDTNTSTHEYKLGDVSGTNKAETQANKNTSTSLSPTNDTVYPTNKAVKTYIDAQISSLNSTLTTAIAAAKAQAKDELYPIGSIYDNGVSSTNPGTLLGFGTWVAETYIERIPLSTKILQWSTGDVLGSTTKQLKLGTYDYNMLTNMLNSNSGTMTIPTGWHVEYKMQAELGTSGGVNVRIFLNNIYSNWVQTWSGDSFRSTAATDFFKASDIILETTTGYTNPGINFGWVADNASANVRVYLPTITAYIVRDTPTYKWRRTA